MGTLDAFSNAPFAPTYNPGYWATGGQAPDKLQDPRYMSRYYGGGGGLKRTSSTQDPTKTYATAGAMTGTRAPGASFVSGSQPWQGTAVAPGNTDRITGSTAGSGASGGSTGSSTPSYGSESGPGILENWFNQRATGTDIASQYATKRGIEALGSRYGAAGLGNSGAARQGEADLLANIEAQRAGQLDALAGGASGEHQNRLNSMFGVGSNIAGGRSAINSAYDLSAASAQSDALKAALGFYLNKAGVDSQSNQAGLNNIIKLGALFGG